MMCGERDVGDGDHRAAVTLPSAGAVVPSCHRRRRCYDGEDDEYYQEFESEFRKYCETEEKTKLLASAATGVRARKRRATNNRATANGAIAEKNTTGKKTSGGGRTPARGKHGFRGIHRRTYGRWSTEIRDPVKGFRVWLGTYDTAEEAARVYDAEARRIYGPNAKTNFPPPAGTATTSAAEQLPAAPAEKSKTSSSKSPKTRRGARRSGRDITAGAGVGAKKRRGQRANTTSRELAEHGGGKAGGRRQAASEHGFRGIYKRTSGRWSAEIRDRIKGCRVWLGTYNTVEEAARVYDVEARKIYGPNAKTNLPAPPATAEKAMAYRSMPTKTRRGAGARRGDHCALGVNQLRAYGRTTYDAGDAAERAYGAEARRIHGGQARTNFPSCPDAPTAKKPTQAPAAEIVDVAPGAAGHDDDDWLWDFDIERSVVVEPATELVGPDAATDKLDDGPWDFQAYMKLLSEVELDGGIGAAPPPPPPPPQPQPQGFGLDYLLLMMCN